jgi:hypothetical protein
LQATSSSVIIYFTYNIYLSQSKDRQPSAMHQVRLNDAAIALSRVLDRSGILLVYSVDMPLPFMEGTSKGALADMWTIHRTTESERSKIRTHLTSPSMYIEILSGGTFDGISKA